MIATALCAALAAAGPAIDWYVAPDYPRPELMAGIEADVPATLVVDKGGRVVTVVLAEDAPPGFAAPALAAAKAMRFRPSPVSTNVETAFRFLLQRRQEEEVALPPDAPAGAVAGEVLAAGVRTPLVGVDVLAVGLGLGATTDAHGRYSLRLPPGDHALLVAAPEFAPALTRITVVAGETAALDFRAHRRVVGGLEATVRGEQRPVAASKSTIGHEELRNVPGSQNDPVRVIENLPGVARAPFSGGQLVVRGARPTDTGAYFDGQRIPILYHLLNGPSVLAEDMVERIDFFAGGAGAYYGRQLAGIVEVVPRSSEVERIHGSVAADLNKSSAFLRGPAGESTRFAAGARLSYVNPVLRFMADSRKPYQVPVYWDYQGRLDQRLPDDSRLYLTAFGSGDSYSRINPARGNTESFNDQEVKFHRFQLRWEKRLSETASLTLSPQAGFGDEVTRTQGTGAGAFALPQRTADQSRSLGLRSQLTVKPAGWIEGHAGTDVLFERVAYQADRELALQVGVVQTGVNAQRVQFDGVGHFGNFGGYLEAVIAMGILRITPGLRVDALHWTGHTHVVADPRLWARAQITPSTAVYGYAGLYHQAPEATELDPKFGNPDLMPERAQQYGAGAEQKLGVDWTVRLEAFLQRRDALTFAGVASLRPDGTVSAPLVVNSGIARSAGFEVLIRREISARFYGWLAYTFSRSQQLQRPGFSWEPTPFDEPHVLTVLVGFRPSTQVEFAARLRVASGNPIAEANGSVFDSDTGNYSPYAKPFGSSTLPAFAQLDLQINNIWTADDFRLSFYLDVQNVLGRRNAEVLVYDARFTQPDTIPGLPVKVSIGARVTW